MRFKNPPNKTHGRKSEVQIFGYGLPTCVSKVLKRDVQFGTSVTLPPSTARANFSPFVKLVGCLLS